MEGDLKMLKVKYSSNLWLDNSQISNLNDQTIFYKFLNWRLPPMKDVWNSIFEKLDENSDEILSVALLSPACF